MTTTDSTTRGPTTWVSILLIALLISAGCGDPASGMDDGFAFDRACEIDGECDENPDGELRDDEFAPEFDDDELPGDGSADQNPDGRDSATPHTPGGGRTPATPPSSDGGRAPAAPPNTSGGRTPATPPNTDGGTTPATPPNTGEGTTPAIPSDPGGGSDPVVPAPECTPGESRCVAGEAGVVEQCDASGFWTTVSCGTAELCTDSECTLACELSVEPSDPYVCYVPNKDGVNDGVLWVSNDLARMENGTYTGIVVHYTSEGREAPIRRVPSDIVHTGSWPYEWKLASAGTLRQAMIEFRLDQLSSLPGSLRTVEFTYWARRAPAIVIPDPQVTINHETRALVFAWSPSDGYFDTDSPHVLDYAYFGSEIRTRTIPPVLGSKQFDHAGEVNAMGIEIVGDAQGGLAMDAFVNFVMLTVR
jgi:hypothetical protein